MHSSAERLARTGADEGHSVLPFSPLQGVFGDPEMADLFSERAFVESWLEVERALACVQAELGVIPTEAAAAIADEAVIEKVDFPRLRERTRVVGYPIVPLLDQIVSDSSQLVGRYIHWGTTTQDIMDTGLALQMRSGLRRMHGLEIALCRQLSVLADRHRTTILAGRTHAQQAVPTTLGAKVAVWLDEVQRHVERLWAVRRRVIVIQLFGAAGTAAALGGQSQELRHRLAARLEIGSVDVPWHTSRDGLAELGFVLACAAATCGKIAREIIELSRTELDELREVGSPDHGASSTMPQKANPSTSEAIVGMSALARDRVSGLLAAMQGAHERSAGEWQVEWDAIPTLFSLAAACVDLTCGVISTVRVLPDRMRANMESAGGTLMAEAAMMALAPHLGRQRAHELVSAACREARDQQQPFAAALAHQVDERTLAAIGPIDRQLDPYTYLGEADSVVASALRRWAAAEANDNDNSNLQEVT